MRRQDDARIEEILAAQVEFKELLNKIENHHAEFYGRMDERVLNHEKEIKKHADELQSIYSQRSVDRANRSAELKIINDKLQVHSEWMANAVGRATGMSLMFSFIGAAVMWLFDHVIHGWFRH